MSDAIHDLTRRQLDAYNRSDLDAFCACFHDEVEVLDASGAVTLSGMDAFRDRYGTMFSSHADVSAIVLARLQLGAHVVEYERWQRTSRSTGESASGEVLVRYTERDGRIRWVEFLRP